MSGTVLTNEDRHRFEWWRLNHIDDTNVCAVLATLIEEVKKLEYRVNRFELPPEKHGCSTGDCVHTARQQCAAELENFYGPDWTNWAPP